MANTYTLIASNTLSSSAASVTFSSIPATYTDLVLKWSARSTASADIDDLQIRINSDTATNYSLTMLETQTTIPTSERTANSTYLINRGNINGANSTSNTFTNSELYLPSYTVSQNKPISFTAMIEGNYSTSYRWLIGAYAGLWRNNATVSTILLQAVIGSFVSGSSFFLYGIKAN